MNNTNNTTQSTDQSAAQSSTPQITTVQALVAEANRHGLKVCGGFQPPRLIPLVEAAIANHNTRERGYSETSSDYIEWKQHMDSLQQFLALLKTLPERLPYESATGTATAPALLPSDDHDLDEEEDFEDEHEDDDDFDEDEDEDDDSDTDSLIEKVKKYLDEHRNNAREPRRQPLTHGAPGVADPLHPRSSPVADPLDNALDASSNVSPNASESAESKLAQERADYLAQLLRESSSGKSPIDDFPPERQQTLYRLVNEHPLTLVAKMLAPPEPLGWGFKTSHASLRRFRERYREKAEATELANAMAEARDTIQKTGSDEQAYIDATRRLLKIRLYKNAADPEGSDDQIELIMRLLDRQRRTDLAERRVQVLEQVATAKAK